MSKMGQVHMEIVELIDEGMHPTKIAKALNVPLTWVYDVLEQVEGPEIDDSMDGDAASALASAGWGTDEDYGYASDEF